jgi:hypothetical protein
MAKDKEVMFRGRDISKCVFRRKTYPKNNLSMTLSNNPKNNRFIMVYHSFGMKQANNFRWYDGEFEKAESEKLLKLDSKKRILHYTIPEWEDELEDGTYIFKTNVPIKIYFTESGWRKFIKYYDSFKEQLSEVTKKIKKQKTTSKKKTTKRKAPAKKKTTKRKAPAKKKTTKRKSPAKKKTTKRKSPAKKKTTKRKTTKRKR